MSTCNRLDLQTLGSQPVMPKNLPDHWTKEESLPQFIKEWDCMSPQLHYTRYILHSVVDTLVGPRIRGTQVKSSVRMKKTQESSKWLFLDNLIPEIESKAPN